SDAPRSLAISSVMRFSKPSRRSLENGRLLGSAATRSTRFGSSADANAEDATSATATSTAGSLRKAENIERASGCGVLGKVLHGVDETKGAGAVAGIELTRDDSAGPTAHAGEDRHVL